MIERRWLRPLVPLYAAAVMAKNAAYDHHLLEARRLVAPVISIGNLSVGGAGKTPLVIRLAQLLSARGLAVDVLSRGYGRRSGAAEQVRLGTGQVLSAASAGFASGLLPARAFSAGKQADQVVVDPGRYGDEPLLIAQAASVPVYLGASRYAAGLLAEQRAADMPRVHLLDDGFQHRRLARVVDLVVLHPGDPSQMLLPAGRLREPLSALRRASVAVLRNEGADPGAGLAWRAWLCERYPLLPVWSMTREIALASHPAPAIAFCGIAHPAEFFRSLERAGASLLARHAFRDHHAYTDADIASLLSSARATGARTLLTTEKDLVRLSPRHCARLGEAATLQAVPLRVTLQDEDAVVDQLLALAGLAE